MSQKLSVMRLYSAQTCTHGFIQYIPIISVVIGTFSDLLYMEFYRTIFCEHLLLFPLLKIVMQFLLNHKTKQHWLYKFTVFVIFIIYIQYGMYSPQKHPQFPLEESSMLQSKKGQQKGRHFRKTTVLCRSTFFISLWAEVIWVWLGSQEDGKGHKRTARVKRGWLRSQEDN